MDELKKEIELLKQQNKELRELFNDFISEIKSLCFKAESPLMDNSHQIDTRALSKKCTEMNIKINNL